VEVNYNGGGDGAGCVDLVGRITTNDDEINVNIESDKHVTHYIHIHTARKRHLTIAT